MMKDELGLSEEKKTVFWQNQLATGLGTTLVAIEDKQIVGWASGGPSCDGDEPGVREIYAIYVDPAFWRRGVGRNLMDEIETVLADATALVLWVLRENEPALRFYATLGYRPDGGQKKAVFGHATFIELRLSKPVAV